MLVRWALHAKYRFAERAARFGINYGEIELAIKKQEIRIKEGRNKIRTIFKIGDTILAAVKIEKPSFVHVLTLWEANESEVERWKRK